MYTSSRRSILDVSCCCVDYEFRGRIRASINPARSLVLSFSLWCVTDGAELWHPSCWIGDGFIGGWLLSLFALLDCEECVSKSMAGFYAYRSLCEILIECLYYTTCSIWTLQFHEHETFYATFTLAIQKDCILYCTSENRRLYIAQEKLNVNYTCMLISACAEVSRNIHQLGAREKFV